MMAKHPRNGPSLSKATYKADRPSLAPSPERRRAAQEQDARDADKSRRLHQEINKDGILAYLRRRGML